MSDAVQIALIFFAFLFLLAVLFKDTLRDRIRSGGSIDARAKLPAGFEGHFTLGATQPQLSEKEKGELEAASKKWNKHKTGDIYWLASDLTLAIPVARQSDPSEVRHYVRQTYWHTSQLALGEPIEGRFARLCEKTASFTMGDWNNPERREEVSNELGALLHAIAFVMEGEDKEFQGKPPDGWRKC